MKHNGIALSVRSLAIINGEEVIQLTKSQYKLVDKLQRHVGEWVMADVLIDWLYADDPNGGPDYAKEALRVFVYQIRERVGQNFIESCYYHGYRIQKLGRIS